MSRFTIPFTLASALLATACAADDPGDALTKDEARAAGKADNGFDYCEAFGWYGDGECDTFCNNIDPDCSTDGRTPELGADVSVALESNLYMSDALEQSEASYGPTIEAKLELDDDNQLSLSVYPTGQSIETDAERNVFEEVAGSPSGAAWRPTLEQFHDQEHLTRSARDLTLVQLSRYSLLRVVKAEEWLGFVYWAIPTIQQGRAGYGVYVLDDDRDSQYLFVDGGGSAKRQVTDLGTGPGSGATDARTPELGSDLTIVRQSRIKMSDALRQVAATHGPAIEAKFELDGDGKLSLSIYPVGKGIAVDSEHNTFFELAGDPTASTFAPSLTEFVVPDEEHLTRSSRDLTLVQTAGLTLLDAVVKAETKFPGGRVTWAIPTRRGTRAGFGIYVVASDGRVHYLFIS